MKFFVNRVLLGLKGQPLLDVSGGASVPLTLGSLAVEALLRDLPQDQNTAGSIRIARHNLAKRIEMARSVINAQHERELIDESVYLDLRTEDVNLIKGRILAPLPSGFATLVVGAAEEAIEMGEPESEVSADLRELPDPR